MRVGAGLQALASWAELGPTEESESSRSPRGAWACVGGILALYLASCAILHPTVVTVIDEAFYLRDARTLSTGGGDSRQTDPFTGRVIVTKRGGRYPLGTAMLMAPFVALGGWRGAYVVPLSCVAAGVLLTGLWLRSAGRSPLYALAILGYPPTLVMGRLALSDAPSLAVCALGLLCFWRGRDGPFGWWLASGLLAGASILFRESNMLVFAPLFAGALLRRNPRVAWLAVGGAVGVSLRVLTSALFHGDAFFYKPPAAFELGAVLRTTPIYLAALLLLVPGGLAAGIAYRGERRPEIVATVLAFTVFYCVYSYEGADSGPLKQLVLGPRFFLPLLPVLAFALAEVAPRAFAALSERLRRLALMALATWVAGVALAAVAVPVALDRWSVGQAEIRDTIDRLVPRDKLLVTNSRATFKFVGLQSRRLPMLHFGAVGSRQIRALLRRHGVVYIAILDRSDSAFWRRQAEMDEYYVTTIRPDPELLYDRRITADQRLRIWRVERRRRDGL